MNNLQVGKKDFIKAGPAMSEIANNPLKSPYVMAMYWVMFVLLLFPIFGMIFVGIMKAIRWFSGMP